MFIDPSPVLYFELGLAILLAAWALCAKPEYGLFLYGLALGFPDVAIPLGTAINLRFDDALIVFFLFRSILWTPMPLAPAQRKIIAWQTVFLLICFLSVGVGMARGIPPAQYETIKMIGCAAIVLALPRVVQSERRLRFLIAGLICAGVVLLLQIIQRLGASSANILGNFQELKNAATFATWNPNTIGQAAMLLVFAAGLGWIVFPKSFPNRFLWSSLSMGFALTPALMFVRGTSLCIAGGYVLFLCLTRSWKSLLIFLIVCGSALIFVHSVDPELVDGATHVDLATGEGLSHRFDRWDAAIDAIQAEPFLGRGFGQEWIYMSGAGSEGRAHNAYLSVWIELGVGGLALLLAVVYQFVSAGISLYRRPQFQYCGALVLALTTAAFLDSFGLPTLYWEKLPTISLSLAVALIGICERNALVKVQETENALEMQSIPRNI
jgi:O-antigen ligase